MVLLEASHGCLVGAGVGLLYGGRSGILHEWDHNGKGMLCKGLLLLWLLRRLKGRGGFLLTFETFECLLRNKLPNHIVVQSG